MFKSIPKISMGGRSFNLLAVGFFIAAGFLFLNTSYASAADRYWVGGTGNWNDTTHWSATSGGAGSAGVPTASDNCIFNTSSSTANAAYTVTVNAAATCLDFTMDGPHPSDSTKVTWAGSSTLAISGSMSLTGGTAGITRTYTGGITFNATSSGKTITSFGVTLGSTVTFNGVGGSWTFADAYNGAAMTLTNGSIAFGTFSHAMTAFSSTNSNTRSIDLGGSNISFTGTWNTTVSTNLTIPPNTATFFLASAGQVFAGGGMNYNGASLNINTAGSTSSISGSNTFYNVTVNGDATKNNGINIAGGTTLTVTNNLTINGNSAVNRMLVQSTVPGTAATLSAANTPTITNADFMDITGGGAGSWDLSNITGKSGDAGGNSGITFTAPTTQTWSGTSGGNWSTNAWSGRVPLPQDDAVIASAFSASQTVTADMPRLGTNITWSGATGAPTWSFASTANSIYGGVTLISGMTISGTQALTFRTRTSVNLTFAGKTMTQSINFTGPGGTWTLQDGLTSSGSLVLNNGTFDANGFNVTALGFSSSAATVRGLNMGSGAWTFSSTAGVWNLSTVTNLTFNASTSTIFITNTTATSKTFAGGGLTYNIVTFSGDNITVTGNNTFNTLNANTAGLTNGLKFTAGTTQTVTNFYSNGAAGSLAKVLSTTASTATLTKASGIVVEEYMSLTSIAATGGATWYAGSTSTNVSGNSGWLFSDPATNATYSGTIYSDEGVTVITTLPTVRIKVNGNGNYSAAANGSGAYSIAIYVNAGDVVTAYIDGATEDAVTVTRAAGTSNLTGLDLYQNIVIVRSEDGNALTNANMDSYDAGNDADIDFTVTNGALTVTAGSTLLLNTTSTFVPGNTITTDTLKQTDGTINAGSATWLVSITFTQTGGTFNGNAATITFGRLFLSAGTFNSTTGILSIGRAVGSGVSETIFSISTGASFIHNSGTVKFAPSHSACCTGGTFTADVDTSLTLYNVEIAAVKGPSLATNPAVTTASGDTIVVLANITHTDGLIDGTWELKNHLIVASGADGGTGTITFDDTDDQTYAVTSGGRTSMIDINKSSGTVSASSGTTELSISKFTLTQGTFSAPTGILTIGRNNTSGVNETVFSVASGTTFTHNNGTIKVDNTNNCCNGGTYTMDVDGSLTIGSLETTLALTNGIPAVHPSLTTGAGDIVIVTGNLTHSNSLLNGSWEVQGNVTIGAAADGGTATITYTGANAQTYTDAGGVEPSGDITINKTSPTDTVTLASTTDWDNTNQDLTVTSGTFRTGGFNLTGPASGVFTVANGSAFEMSGDSNYPASYGTYTYGATSTVRYLQNQAKTITNASYGHLDLKPAAAVTFTLPSTLSAIAGSLTLGDGVNAGTVTAATNNPAITVRGDLTVNDNITFTKGSGVFTFAKGGTQTWTDNSAGQELGDVVIASNSTNTTVNLAGNPKATSLTINSSQTTNANTGSTLTLTGALNINGSLTQTSTGNLTTGGTITVGASGLWSNIGSGSIVLAGDVSNAGSIILNSDNGVSCVDSADTIIITSSSGGTQRTWSGAGTFTIYNVNATDQAGTITAYTSTLTNTTWSVGVCGGGITISGTVYSDEGSTLLTSAPTVRIKVNGLGDYSAAANGSGVYSISSVEIDSASDVITVYLDGETEKAVTITKAVDTSTNITDLNLYQNYVIVSHEDAGPMTNANLGQYDSDDDNDIGFSSNSNTLTVSSGNTLYVTTGKIYTPGGNISTPNLKNIGTMNAGSNTIVISGTSTPFVNSGTFNYGSSTVRYTGDGAIITALSGSGGSNGYYNLELKPSSSSQQVLASGTFVVNNNLIIGDGTNAGATAATNNPSVTVANNFTIAANAVFNSTSVNLYIGRNFTNSAGDAGFVHNSGTVRFNTTATSTISGATTFHNFTVSDLGGSKTIEFQKATTGAPVFNIAGTMTITGGVGGSILVQSTEAGSQWLVDFQNTQTNITYVVLKDSGCVDSANVVAHHSITNAGNNGSCWSFIIFGGGGGGGGGDHGSGGGGGSSGGGAGSDGDEESGGGNGTTGGGSGGGGGGNAP